MVDRGDGQIFKGAGTPRSDWLLPEAPPWRQFGSERSRRKGETYQASRPEIDLVNAAIYLRRPLLITGRPGVGKTSLAHAVAWELGLGEVLNWPINTRSTLQQGLYDYDAIGRVRDASLERGQGEAKFKSDIGRYLRLGPLGTAFLGGPNDKPRVLLVDEVDKSDIDLPNDLLNIFEEGEFRISELARLSESLSVEIPTIEGKPVEVKNGLVSCVVFPVVFLTSNGEREFPPAFLRRCLRLDITSPDEEALRKIVYQHLGIDAKTGTPADKVIREFLELRDTKKNMIATDQLLNAVFMVTNGSGLGSRDALRDTLLRPLADNQ